MGKAKELETIEQNNKLEMDRLKELQNKAEEEKGKLEAQREEMLKLQTLAENETDEGKKRRMTVQIRQFANKFQSAERKVKRMEEEYNKSVKNHENKMKAEELRRKEKLRMRREMLKTRRKMRNGRPTKKNVSTLGAIDEPTTITEESAEVFTMS